MATKKKKKIKYSRFIFIILLVSTIYLIRHILSLGPVEKLIRYIIIGIIAIINLIIFKKCFSRKKNVFLSFVMIILIVINILGGHYINRIYSALSNISSNKTTYSTSLVVMNSNKSNEISKIKNYTIGILNDKSSKEGYELPQKMIKKYKLNKKNTIKKYSSYPELLEDLYSSKLDAAFLPTNYKSMFSNIDKYKKIDSDIKIIIKEEEKAKEKTYGNKSIEEPFTMLLMGIDSTKDGLENSDSFNGDSLMVVTFNPKTLNATILSIPRDSYVPIMCFEGHYENKITHAAWKGTDCVIKTIENFLNIKIDYYAKINFRGLIDLVEQLGGIEVEVPKRLCTNNSKRRGKVCINPGLQKLNGEEALVLARNRKQLANGDIDRGVNQQIVLQGIIDKIKDIKDVNKLLDILNSISKNLDMNMKEDTILSFYNVGKEIIAKSRDKSTTLTLQRLYLAGIGQIIYDEKTNLNLWNYILNEDSVKDVSNEMKTNLGLKKPEIIKTFSFTIDEPYEKKTVGKGPYSEYTSYDLLPDFTGDTRQQALNWASNHGLTVIFNEVSSGGASGRVIGQNYPFRKRIDKIPNRTVTLTIVS